MASYSNRVAESDALRREMARHCAFNCANMHRTIADSRRLIAESRVLLAKADAYLAALATFTHRRGTAA
jgi:hypothetical protein